MKNTMKFFAVTLLGIIFLLVSLGTVNAQETLTISKVIQLDSVGKPLLFASVNDWFATTYNSANDVIQMADKEAGIIIGNGSMQYSFGKTSYVCYDGYIKYTIKVYVKDNRYKVELTNFTHLGNGPQCALGLITTADIYTDTGLSKKYHNSVWVNIKTTVEGHSNSIFNSIEKHTKSSSTESSEGDW